MSVKRAFFMFRSPLFAFAATRGRSRCRFCPALMGATHPCVSAEFHGHPLQGVPRSYPAPTRGTVWHPASALGLQAVPPGVCKHAVPAVLLEEELLCSCQGSFRISPPSPAQSAPPRSCPVCRCRAHAVLPCREGPRLMCSVKGLYRRDMRILRVRLRPRRAKGFSRRP